MIELKLGKTPAATDDRDLKFAAVKDTATLPTTWPKANFGNGTLFKNWGMLGNDEVGDCVIASRAHLTMLSTSAGAPATARFTTASVISEYGRITGYLEGDPSTDQGTDMRVMCADEKQHGLLDADGHAHRIGAYLRLDTGNLLELLQAVYALGGACIGFAVPESAMEQFDRGEPWDDVGDDNILGGHEVCAVGTMNWRDEITVVTWGRRQVMTKAFLARYMDEGWARVMPEILNAQGKYRGLDITRLNEALHAL